MDPSEVKHKHPPPSLQLCSHAAMAWGNLWAETVTYL